MGDTYATVKVAAVQAASVFLDREGSTDKACRLISEAGRAGARMIAFPEGFIPAHPVWYHHHAATGAIANRLSVELFKNSVEIPGPQVDALCRAAREANAYVVIGVCEKLANTFGTMFNTQLYIGPDGALIRKHQKIMPTVGERLVHTGGYGDTFGAFADQIRADERAHLRRELQSARRVRAYRRRHPHPRHELAEPFPDERRPDAQPRRDRQPGVRADEQGVRGLRLRHGRRPHDRDAEPGPEAEKFLRNSDCCGGSVIVAPNSRIIAGPMGAEEAILYADCNLELGILMKLRHDFAGHYNRPDIFQLHVNRTRAASLRGARAGRRRRPARPAPTARLSGGAVRPSALLDPPDEPQGPQAMRHARRPSHH